MTTHTTLYSQRLYFDIWSHLSTQIQELAVRYVQKYNCPMVLVLDQIDCIAKTDPYFLQILQYFAKDCADGGLLVLIFVSDEDFVPQLMQCKDVMILIFCHIRLTCSY